MHRLKGTTRTPAHPDERVREPCVELRVERPSADDAGQVGAEEHGRDACETRPPNAQHMVTLV